MTDSGKQKFGWKRKIGAQVSKAASSAFEGNSKDETDPEIENGDVDWLTLAPTRKKMVIGLEDNQGKAKRLIQEGTVLASSERFWEALKKWDEALQYLPCDEKIHEMKAQALMELCEVFPAVQSAKKAVQLAPTWWIAHQTLGRAYLGLGEVKMAVQSFSRAVHLNPADKELWEDDLIWAKSLLEKRKTLEREKQEANKMSSGVKITELDCESCGNTDESSCDVEKRIDVYKHQENIEPTSPETVIGKLPRNYVQMRDYLPP